MIAKGKSSATLDSILSKVTESQILSFYLGITKVPTMINSPLREDKKPSFGIYSPDGKKIRYKDFSTNEKGGLFDLLGSMWHLDFQGVIAKIDREVINHCTPIKVTPCKINSVKKHRKGSSIECKIREWKDYDIEYWNSYGITLEWLKWAEVFPISHKIIYKDNAKYTFKADKLAYVFIERKEGKISKKIYQPYNTQGYKWSNTHDGSVISLWTKIPKEGERVVICSSLKDALCLSCNTYIPALALQGEGYSISDTAIEVLKKRFRNVYILFDSDEAGIMDAEKLSKDTGFINITPKELGGEKDLSDLYKCKGKDAFLKIILSLFKT